MNSAKDENAPLGDGRSDNSKRPRLRFSVHGALLMMAFWAVALYGWRAFIYEPPTHKIPLYEKASSTRRLAARIGPNKIGISRVARNRRDGSLSVEDGRGGALPESSVTNAQILKQAAAWLDIAQFELEPGPELFDIIDVRIFNHETRALLSDESPRYGWQMRQSNLLQVYGFGKELPGKIDVWLRFHSYEAKDRVFRLAPHVDAMCELPAGSLRVREIESGSWAFDSRISPSMHQKLDDNRNQFSAVIAWSGKGRAKSYQIAAVSRNGEKAHTDYPHFFRYNSPHATTEFIRFRMPLAEVDHFELRPFGGRHRFFFEAVELPKTAALPFSPSPTALLPVQGKETTVEIPEFAPLAARLSTHRGNWANGSQSSGTWVSITPHEDGATNLDKEFTVVYYMRGLGQADWELRFKEFDTGKMNTEAEFSQRGNGSARGSTLQAGYKNLQRPLEQVEAIEVKLQPAL